MVNIKRIFKAWRYLLESGVMRNRKIIRRSEILCEDGHDHTDKSDGEFGLLELMLYHKPLGFRKVVITDHDFFSQEKTRGKALWIKVCCRLLKMQAIYGAEFTCRLDVGFLGLKKRKKIGMHIIGREFDPDNPGIRQAMAFMAESRLKRCWDLIAEIKIQRPDLILPTTLVKEEGVMTSTDVARKICELNPQEDFLKLLRSLLTEKPYHLYYEKLDAEETIRNIKLAGGKVVLAHVVKTLRENFCQLEAIVERLVPMGLDGIEVFARGQTLGQTIEIIDVCEKYKLVLYAGSDMHGIKNLVDYVEMAAQCSKDPEILLRLQKYKDLTQA